MISVSLVCHPATPMDAVRGISVGVERASRLELTFHLDADLGRIRVPPTRRPAVVHQLWEHTCFEVFVAENDAAAYHELNLAPSGEWAGYRFRDYREIDALVDDALAPPIAVSTGADRLTLDASIELARLSPDYAGARLRLGLSAVIEDTEGRRSYWALRHPTGQPDFHHRDTRALLLEPVRREW
jgi:hypothetical protein